VDLNFSLYQALENSNGGFKIGGRRVNNLRCANHDDTNRVTGIVEQNKNRWQEVWA